MNTNNVRLLVYAAGALALGTLLYKEEKKHKEEKARIEAEEKERKEKERAEFLAHKEIAEAGCDYDLSMLKASVFNEKLDDEHKRKAYEVLEKLVDGINKSSTIASYDLAVSKFNKTIDNFSSDGSSLFVEIKHDKMIEARLKREREAEIAKEEARRKEDIRLEERRIDSEERYRNKLISSLSTVASAAVKPSDPITITLLPDKTA